MVSPVFLKIKGKIYGLPSHSTFHFTFPGPVNIKNWWVSGMTGTTGHKKKRSDDGKYFHG